MQKVIRILAISLVVIATASVVSTPANQKNVVFAEGSSPVPLCVPTDKSCRPPL